MVLRDTKNEDWDEKVSSFVLNVDDEYSDGKKTGIDKTLGSKKFRGEINKENETISLNEGENSNFSSPQSDGFSSLSSFTLSSSQSKWSFNKLQKYIGYSRRLRPVLTRRAQRVLSRFYCMQRVLNQRSAARTTISIIFIYLYLF
jgi:DNA replicative helicase MCM subunit Mcm2 (Cdc46/Mcm family)